MEGIPNILSKKEILNHFHGLKNDSEQNRELNVFDYTSSPEKRTDTIRFVIISDTHSQTKDLHKVIPTGDILLHCGDFTSYGRKNEIEKFNTFLSLVKDRFKFIIVIAGNHERTFDPSLNQSKHENVAQMKKMLQNCIYLEDNGIDLLGMKIYGTPWHPEYRHKDAFSVKCGEDCLSKWNDIPQDVDVLITHTPPYGFCDSSQKGKHTGCIELLATVQKRVKPTLHAFGHMHEAYGMATDGFTTYVNASTCTSDFEPTNLPIIFDIPIKENSQ